MAQLTPQQRRTRERTEALIRLMQPGLNVILAVGERISRIAEPDDVDYYPARPPQGDIARRSGSAPRR